MAELKTKVNDASVRAFIDRVEPLSKREDSRALLDLFSEATSEQPKMWGASIVGYGMYHYKSERSTQEGDWPLVAFSPRKQNLSLYLFPDAKGYREALAKLGKHKQAVGCLYINKLSDVDISVLKQLVQQSYVAMKKLHNIS